VTRAINVARTLTDDSTVAVAFGVPGIVDSVRGIARFSANLQWHDVPLRELAGESLRIPVRVEQDVRAACVAEAVIGLGREATHVLMVVLGTGIGSGIVINQNVLCGAKGMAGELGHVPVHPTGDMCMCGQRGCLEAYASGFGITRRYALRGGDPNHTAAQIAASDDDVSALTWADATRALGLALASATMLLDPDLIVLAGGVSNAGQRLLQPVRVALRSQLSWREPPRVELSPLGMWAGRSGVAILAWRHVGLDVADTPWVINADHADAVL
jgi:glucokinase